MVKIKKNFKEAQYRKKSYAYQNRTSKQFQVGDHVFLKVRPKKSSLNLGNFSTLASKYCGPFEVVAKIGHVSYELDLPTCIRVHNVFHVSLLKNYIPDSNHVIDWNVIQVIMVFLLFMDYDLDLPAYIRLHNVF